MKKYTVSDTKLVSLYKEGQEEAFEQLVVRHTLKIYTAIYLIVKDDGVAENLLQEVFIKVVNTIKSGRYNEEGEFLPWVMRIAHHISVDYLRKNRPYPVVMREDGANVFNTLDLSEDSAESIQIKNDICFLLRQLIRELPEAQRQVLTMRHYMNMSFKEIADATGANLNTTLGRMRYALMNLRKKMQKYYIDYDSNVDPKHKN